MTGDRPVGPALTARTARRLVVGGIVVLTAARLVYAAVLGISPQEAYYYAYALHPAPCYLDHPPMVAWWIRAGTTLLGHRAVGLRLAGVLASGAITWILYRLGERLFSPLAGLLVAASANAAILFAVGAVILTPDAPLTLFWAACLLVASDLLLEDGPGPGRLAWRWYLLGILAGCAYLSKFTASLLPLGILAAALLLPRGRRALRTPHPYLAAGLSLTIFSPVLVWNAEHHFAAFAFQTSRRLARGHAIHPGLLLQSLGTQALVITPVIFAGLVAALVTATRRAIAGDPRHRLLMPMTLPGLAIFTVASLMMWVKMNWIGPIYLGALVALGGLVADRWSHRGIRRAAVTGLALGAGLNLVAHLLPLLPAVPIPPKADVLGGWDALGARATRALAHLPPGSFAAGWDYKTAAELTWHLPRGTVVVGPSAFGGSGRSFDLWLRPRAVAGHEALVVMDDRHDHDPPGRRRAVLARFCRKVDAIATVRAERAGRPITTFHLLRCERYRPPPITRR